MGKLEVGLRSSVYIDCADQKDFRRLAGRQRLCDWLSVLDG